MIKENYIKATLYLDFITMPAVSVVTEQQGSLVIIEQWQTEMSRIQAQVLVGLPLPPHEIKTFPRAHQVMLMWAQALED